MENCIFCKVAHGAAHSWKVYEDDYTYAFLDINPVNEYHMLIIPKNHYENIFDVTESELLHIMQTIKKIVDVYHNKLGINNVQIINSSGAEAHKTFFIFIFILYLEHMEMARMSDGLHIKNGVRNLILYY